MAHIGKITEVAFTSDGTGQLWNSCAWDLKTGTPLATFKGGISGAKSLSLIGDSYLISAQKEKPLLQVWSLNGKEQQQMKIVCPGKVSALAVALNGECCAAAIDEKFHLWQVSDGTLLAVVARHFQPISCLKFSFDGSHIFTAGEDGLVMAWSLGRLVEESNDPLTSSAPEPDYLWSDHALRVSDICIGIGGQYGRIATVSSDMTCKVYELLSGRLLVSFVLGVAATAAAFDSAEYNVFVGGTDGQIFQIQLTDPPSSQNVHFDDDEKNVMIFKGHTKQVTSLCTSLDGSCLLSGSYDTSARLWHIQSKQCLRVFQHKGPVMNAFLTLAPESLLSATPMKPRHLLNPMFQRSFESRVCFPSNDKSSYTIDYKNSCSEVEGIDRDLNEHVKEDPDALPTHSKDDLLEDLERYRVINQQLFSYSVQSIFNDVGS